MSDRIKTGWGGNGAAQASGVAAPSMPPLTVRLPLDQWQVVVQLLLAAPYVRAKDIIESIQKQASEADQAAIADQRSLAGQLQLARNRIDELERSLRTASSSALDLEAEVTRYRRAKDRAKQARREQQPPRKLRRKRARSEARPNGQPTP